MYTLFSMKMLVCVFLIILKVTPIKRAFGMLRCGFPFYVFIRHPKNQEDGMIEKNKNVDNLFM